MPSCPTANRARFWMATSCVFGITAFVVAGTRIRRAERRLAAAEQALQQARDAARIPLPADEKRPEQEFLATVSHELRTPLNVILGGVHLLKSRAMADPDRAIEIIERNAVAQARLIDELLDSARIVRGRFTVHITSMDLRRAVGAALASIVPAAAAKEIALVQLGDDDMTMQGDEERLEQVAWNLLSNAVKFTPKGGRVTVELSRVGERVRLRVTDSGEGISGELLQHVFDPFRQGPSRSMRAGLGLGLLLVRQIVELHGGTVRVESAGPNRGASFTVDLSAGRPESTQTMDELRAP